MTSTCGGMQDDSRILELLNNIILSSWNTYIIASAQMEVSFFGETLFRDGCVTKSLLSGIRM